MAGRISRRALSEHVAERLLANDKVVIEQLAAHLIETRRTKDIDLYVYDIEYALLQRGVVVADVSAARDLAKGTQAAIAEYLKRSYEADTVELRHVVDEDLIGGVKVRTADAEYDTTVKRKLTKLQKMKV